MNRINILSDSVKNKIAAGEVVEGPFSVIKELLENSIDAGSDNIDVEIFEGGLNKLSVKDNGCGIYRDDLPLTVESHATSKIKDISDIENIISYGFRGEALSSISSISKFTMLSRSEGEETGAKLVNYNGNPEVTDYAGPAGTTVIVENLFFNVPARKKFLKSKGAETRKIREIFIKTAIANPKISFSLTVDGKRQMTLNSVDKIGERLEQVHGKNILDNLYYDSLQDIKVKIAGYLSKPEFLKSSRSMQTLYINNRFVEYRPFGFLMSKAYEAIAPKGSHPAAFIFITIDPGLIDVNIHPAKREVKFFDQRYIDNMILHLPEKILGDRVHKINTKIIKPENAGGDVELKFRFQNDKVNENNGEKSRHNITNEAPGASIRDKFTIEKTLEPSNGSVTGNIVRESAALYGRIKGSDDIKTLGVIFNTYILIEEDNAIHFIDFHAAHERFIYDRITAQKQKIETQSLIFPQVIELSVEDYQTLIENGEYFLQAGFDIDIFSESSVIIRGIPHIIEGLDIQRFFLDTIDSLKENSDYMKNAKKLIAEKLACHSAKRSGDALSEDDAIMIAREAFNGKHELRCPHGRPYIFRLEKKDLEKVFKRL